MAAGRLAFVFLLSTLLQTSTPLSNHRTAAHFIMFDLNANKLAILPRLERRGYAANEQNNFGKWILDTSKEKVNGFWKDVLSNLEGDVGLKDFNMCILPHDEMHAKAEMLGELGVTSEDISESPFMIIVTHGLPRKGPEKYPVCMSCDMNAQIESGVWGIQDSAACEEYSDICTRDTIVQGGDELSRCVFDAKARDLYVVCPVRHKERMSELDDNELHSFWMSLARMLRALDGDEMRCDSAQTES
jgi:hypothetical protein